MLGSFKPMIHDDWSWKPYTHIHACTHTHAHIQCSHTQMFPSENFTLWQFRVIFRLNVQNKIPEAVSPSSFIISQVMDALWWFHCFILERSSRIKCKWEGKLCEAFLRRMLYVEHDEWDYTERDDGAEKVWKLSFIWLRKKSLQLHSWPLISQYTAICCTVSIVFLWYTTSMGLPPPPSKSTMIVWCIQFYYGTCYKFQMFIWYC